MPVFQGKLDPVSNREDWTYVVEIDDEDDNPVDLTDAAISVTIRDPRYRSVALAGSTADGSITVLDTGVFRIAFAAARLQPMRADTYEVGVVLVQNGVTVQLVLGLLPIVDGI